MTTKRKTVSKISVLKHLDLFSGIGGFALAAKWVGGIETTAFCEIEPWARRVLNKNFPGIPIYEDIRKINGNTHTKTDIVTGGFPCQPYSIGGHQRGQADPRDLWPEMFRVIKECRPRWVVGENSSNLLRLAFGQIKFDLESIGYQVGEPLVIPACAVNSDHRRDRVWLCAHSDPFGLQGGGQKPVSGFPELPVKPPRIFEADRARRMLSEPRMLRSYVGVPFGVDRIKGLGNALCPQIAATILEAIVTVDALS